MMLKGRSVVAIAACVLALHAAALWALHAGLASRKPEVVLPVQMLARLVEPPRPIAPRRSAATSSSSAGSPIRFIAAIIPIACAVPWVIACRSSVTPTAR